MEEDMKEYVKILSSGFKDKISNSNEVSMIKNCNDGVEIFFKNGGSENFDKVKTIMRNRNSFYFISEYINIIHALKKEIYLKFGDIF